MYLLQGNQMTQEQYTHVTRELFLAPMEYDRTHYFLDGDKGSQYVAIVNHDDNIGVRCYLYTIKSGHAHPLELWDEFEDHLCSALFECGYSQGDNITMHLIDDDLVMWCSSLDGEQPKYSETFTVQNVVNLKGAK